MVRGAIGAHAATGLDLDRRLGFPDWTVAQRIRRRPDGPYREPMRGAASDRCPRDRESMLIDGSTGSTWFCTPTGSVRTGQRTQRTELPHVGGSHCLSRRTAHPRSSSPHRGGVGGDARLRDRSTGLCGRSGLSGAVAAVVGYVHLVEWELARLRPGAKHRRSRMGRAGENLPAGSRR